MSNSQGRGSVGFIDSPEPLVRMQLHWHEDDFYHLSLGVIKDHLESPDSIVHSSCVLVLFLWYVHKLRTGFACRVQGWKLSLKVDGNSKSQSLTAGI